MNINDINDIISTSSELEWEIEAMKKTIEEKILEIIKFAQNNEGIISYNVAVDILKDKEDFTEEEILSAIGELGNRGITVKPEEDEGYLAQELIPETFIPAEVNISQKPVNIYNLMERLENDEINLTPSFQRKGNLWSLEQQSRLIESLMLKIPIPAFYFNATDENNWVVIDGLQRLTAFLNFLVGIPDETKKTRIKKKFVGLQYLRDFNEHTFDELPRQYERRIKETAVIAYTVEKGTPDEIVFNIFQRINTGGIVLNDQEIRQALYQGKSTELIEYLANCKEFLEATQNAVRTKRMLDREYVTRFLAFTEVDYRVEYTGNIDSYLIKTMKLVNNYSDQEIDRVEKNFKRIMEYCTKIFGKFAFRKYNKKGRRGPVNKAIFELWAVCFHALTDKQLKQIVNSREEFLTRFSDLQQNTEFVTALKAGDRYSVVRRIDMARNMVKEFI